jgi:hypothetical protein
MLVNGLKITSDRKVFISAINSGAKTTKKPILQNATMGLNC